MPDKRNRLFDPDGNRYAVKLSQQGLNDPLLSGIPATVPVFQLHGQTVELNERIILLGSGAGSQCRNQIVKVGPKAYGLQCHFEIAPALFSYWLDLDNDLRNMNHDCLESEFVEISERHLSIGLTLFRNFLRLAELICDPLLNTETKPFSELI